MHSLFHERRYLIPFRSMLLPHVFTDTLVIGAGVAGMTAALAAAEHGDVILLTKGPLDLSSTAWAQGGIAAAVGEGDSAADHERDTMTTGAGLADARAVAVLVEEGPDAVERLISAGMRFDHDADGGLALGREGGHGRRRILHAGGADTGRELVRCLRQQIEQAARVRVFEHCFAIDLLTGETNGPRGLARSDRRVLGAMTQHGRYGLQIIWAKATILACGGAGRVYRETTNPGVSTGDGIAMAFRAGARVADLELVQFHPTTLYVAGSTRSLVSEAVRGEGAHLVDREGRRFMPDYHEMGELAPRDVVSRAIADHLARTGAEAVYLDVRHLDAARFAERFPGIVQALRSFELDPVEDLIPVHPSAHYTIGGVWTDLDGHSSLEGLYACGETACTGLHGANRLASNSLLEGLVYGRRAGIAAAEMAGSHAGPRQIVSEIRVDEHGELDLVDVRSSLRSAMWRNVGIERAAPRLDDVVDMFDFWARYTLDAIFDDPEGWETENLLLVGALITAGARWRRGAPRRPLPHRPSRARRRVRRARALGSGPPRPRAALRRRARRGMIDVKAPSRAPSSLRRLVGPSLLTIAVLGSGCKPYRIEYRQRPGFVRSAQGEALPERAVEADGTVVVYRTSRPRGALQKRGEGDAEPFHIREEHENGRVVLRALLPEHVLMNTFTCLRNEEYDLLWEQLLSQETRLAYEREGGGVEQFAAFFAKRRYELAATVNRMIHGLNRNEVISDNLGEGRIRLRFVPQVARHFRFDSVTMNSERGGLKLVIIE